MKRYLKQIGLFIKRTILKLLNNRSMQEFMLNLIASFIVAILIKWLYG